MDQRKEGHSALRLKDGELERFDPHPNKELEEKWEKEFKEIWQKALGLECMEGMTEDDLPVAKTFYFAARRKGQAEIDKLLSIIKQLEKQTDELEHHIQIALSKG